MTGVGKPASARATIQDVASRAGVSRSLVSLVLRGKPGAGPETRERIHKVAADLGYRPDPAAGMLARSSRRIVGLTATLHNPFHAEFVDAIYPIVEERGYRVMLSPVLPSRQDDRAIEALLQFRCDGILLLGPSLEHLALKDLARHAAVVVVGARVRGDDAISVHANESHGVQQVIDHLVGLGHRDILHIDGGNHPASAERRRAYRTSMRRHNLADHVRILAGDHTEVSGVRAARTLLTDPTRMPTAVFASNDRSAIGLLDTLVRAGVQVPNDVSVIGYDDSAFARLENVSLTTVSQNPSKQARIAVESVITAIEGGPTTVHDHSVEPHLIVRATTAKPRGTHTPTT